MSDFSENKKEAVKKVVRHYNRLLFFSGLIVLFVVIQIVTPNLFNNAVDKDKGEIVAFVVEEVDEDLIENGVHVASGLIVDEGYELVLNSCGGCHSLKLVTQNHGNEQDWVDIIRWMQETQKLWDLGSAEEDIVKYLAKNYGPKEKSRRANLKNIEWYELE